MLVLCQLGLLGAVALGLVGPWLVARAIDVHIAQGDRAGLVRVAVAYAAAIGGTLVLTWTSRVGLEVVASSAMARLKARLFAGLLAQDAAFHDRHPPGRLITRVQGDTDALKVLFTEVILSVPSDALLLVGMVAVMLSEAPSLAWLVAAVVPPYLLALVAFRWISPPLFMRMRTLQAGLTGHLNAHLRALPLLRLYGRSEWARRTADALNAEVERAQALGYAVPSIYFNLMGGVRALGFGVVLVVGAGRVAEGTLTVGHLVLGLGYLRLLFEPLMRISHNLATLERARAAALRLRDLEATAPAVRDPLQPSSVPSGALELAFRDVTFRYAEGTPVLRGVSLTVHPGQRVGVVGPTGSGKSTLVQLGLRFRDPVGGQVTLGGLDLRSLSLVELRSVVGYVPQDVELLPGTVLENLGGDPARARRALDRLGVDLSLDREVGERGARLSRGERQLVTFARALLHDPRVLVLDEATSAVDPQTERRVQVALDSLVEGRTTLMVAHRLDTVRGCDRIFVLAGGLVVEEGTHEGLLAAGGAYADLWRHQHPEGQASAEASPAPLGATDWGAQLRPDDVVAPGGVVPGGLLAQWFRRVWSRNLGAAAALLALSAVMALASAVFPWLWREAVDSVSAADQADTLRRVAVWLTLAALAQVVFGMAAQVGRSVMNARIERETRRTVFNHLTEVRSTALSGWAAGDLVTRLVDDAGEKTSWMLCSGVFRAIQGAFQVVGCGVFMALVDLRLTLWITAPLLLLIPAQTLVQDALGRRYLRVQQAISNASAALETALGGMRAVQASGLQPAVSARFGEAVEAQRRAEVDVARLQQGVFLLFGHTWQLGMVPLLLAGGGAVIDGSLTPGGFVTLEGLMLTLVVPMFDLGIYLSRGRQAEAALGRLGELLALPTAPSGHERPAGNTLRGLGLEVGPGRRVGLVGPVGSGKSTVLRHLAGLEGSGASLAGVPLEELDPAWRARMVAFVPQDPLLLPITVRGNVLLGRDVAPAALAEALRLSRLEQDLADLPAGLDTPVGERGVTLSGGQQQRVALARALVGRPAILLLDDVTAALDAATEAAFWRLLAEVRPEAGAVIVTHRPGTLVTCDEVIVLEGGRVVQRGPPDVLARTHGTYRALYGVA